MENRLLISGTITGYPDIDVTDDQFYPIQNYPFQNNTSSFVSIYSLDGGLELDGLYSLTNKINLIKDKLI